MSGLRTVGFRRRATIAFTVEDDVVTILGIFYGGQDYEGALRPAQAGAPPAGGEELT